MKDFLNYFIIVPPLFYECMYSLLQLILNIPYVLSRDAYYVLDIGDSNKHKKPVCWRETVI